jgi:hypothetical protein
MTSLSSIEVRLKANAPACVLDAGLALSGGGLLFAIRLAREWPVWLVRSMWPMIDSDQLYRERPGLLAANDQPTAAVEGLIDALGDWHAAWQRDKIRGVHWPGDNRHESDFPEDADDSLLPRFEYLTSHLISRLNGRTDVDGEWSWQRTCACEALALAAALQTRPTVVIAGLEKGRAPLVVRIWEAFTGRDCPPHDFAGETPLILPERLRIGLPPVLTGGLELAAIHVSAPRALALAPDDDEDDPLWKSDAGLAAGDAAAEPWKGAMLLWHRLQ